jgi:spermidine synthase
MAAMSRSSRVRVENGRRGRSLRIDGTFASFYAPGRPLTESVWDALVAPLLWLPPPKRRSVLILGLGGGSAARLVRALAPRARIVGVERSAEVIRAARRWFDLDALDVEVVRENARHYLVQSRRRFDLVIEDLFVGSTRTLRKPEWLLEDGLELAARRLRRGGLLVSNTIDETAEVARQLRELAPALLRIDVDGFDNRVLVTGPRGLTGRALRSAVGAHRVMRPALAHLSFRRV